jgi:hypothetical protein
MTADTPYSALITRFMPPFGKPALKATPVHQLLAFGNDAELCDVLGKENGRDPEFWYLRLDGTKAVLGPTGMLKSVERLTESNLEMVMYRNNAYGNFWDKDHNQMGGQPLKEAIAAIYQGLDALDFKSAGRKSLFGWNAERLMSRFADYSQLYEMSDIIPEYTDRMNLVKVSEGCPLKCIYCPEPNPNRMVPYSEEDIVKEMIRARELQRKYHQGNESIMNEGFLNTTDLLWFHQNDWTDPIRIVGLFREHFPEIRKIYSFMGVPSVNRTSLEYLKALYDGAEGINRVLIGIESADEATSRFLGKNETYAEKKEALMKLREVGFKVKPIIQIGMVGEGFTDPAGNFVSSRQGLEATARLMADFLSFSKLSRKPDKILISEYIPIEGTPLRKLHEDGKIVTPYHSPCGADDDIKFFLAELQQRGVDIYSSVEMDYESALEGRARNLA